MWLPRLVSVAWISAAAAAVLLLLPRRCRSASRAAGGIAVLCLVVGVLLGVHAMAVAEP
jgi:hypothetical protein